MMTDLQYLAALKRGTCRVLFHKGDGSIRTIRGYALDQDGLRTAGVVPIRCLDSGTFKSFKVESVIEFRRDPVTSDDLAAAGL
jgi:hypothetical protein